MGGCRRCGYIVKLSRWQTCVVNVLTLQARAACACMPDGSTFNGQQNVLRDDYFKSLKMGDVICDDTQVPLIWRQQG